MNRPTEEVKELDQSKDSDRSKFSGVFNYFRRSGKMSMKSVWLLALLALALAFAGFASPAGALSRIDDKDRGA